jgi:uncharacterized membrane protein
MPTKYDTNPLDPEFPEKARAAAESLPTQTLPYRGAETRQFAGTAMPEDPTRRFGSPDVTAYSTTYNGQYYPTAYAAPLNTGMSESSSRKVAKVGLPENVLTAVPYIPWYIGMVAGLLVLLLVPRSETKVRFHAAQGLAAHIGILLVTTILGVVGEVTNVANFGNGIFQLVTSIMLVIFAVKAWRGKPVHTEAVDGLTNWLEEKISPRL